MDGSGIWPLARGRLAAAQSGWPGGADFDAIQVARARTVPPAVIHTAAYTAIAE